jgi:hypothetical protein
MFSTFLIFDIFYFNWSVFSKPAKPIQTDSNIFDSFEIHRTNHPSYNKKNAYLYRGLYCSCYAARKVELHNMYFAGSRGELVLMNFSSSLFRARDFRIRKPIPLQ